MQLFVFEEKIPLQNTLPLSAIKLMRSCKILFPYGGSVSEVDFYRIKLPSFIFIVGR